jgi:hypothetical protein
MTDILNLIVIGLVAGMVACLWTRIIKKGMLMSFIGKRLKDMDNVSLIRTNKHSKFADFMRCGFCLSVWICLFFEIIYLACMDVAFWDAFIGIMGGLGAGNLVCEVIHSLRNEEVR